MSESIDRDETSLVKHDETSVVYEPPDLREVGVFGDVTQGPSIYQPEANGMGMV
jgi:hypothetical protein